MIKFRHVCSDGVTRDLEVMTSGDQAAIIAKENERDPGAYCGRVQIDLNRSRFSFIGAGGPCQYEYLDDAIAAKVDDYFQPYEDELEK